MIRYSCDACGKSLRADDSIIGRKAKCTRCNSVTPVPPFSTRQTSKKTAVESSQDSEAESADSHEFPDLKTARETWLDGPVISPILPSLKPKREAFSVDEDGTAKTASARSGKSTASSGEDEFQTGFSFAGGNQTFGLPLHPGLLVGLALLLSFGGLGWWWIHSTPANVKPETAFSKTTEAIAYESALFNLNKSGRALIVAGNGFLSAKRLPESELGDLGEFLDSIVDATQDKFPIEEANVLFDSGDRKAASKLITEETRRLKKLRQEVMRRADEFKKETYARTSSH